MNSKEEFVDLITQHQSIVQKIAGVYTEGAEDKNDLVQEILLQAWRAYPRFEGRSKFSTWFYKVALNCALSHKKHNQKRNLIDSEDTFDVSHSAQPVKDYEILYYVIKRLNPVDRMIMTLHLEGYKNMEVAEMLGLSQNHLNVRIHRLKQRISNDYLILLNESNG